jgi:GR25 family glycosyltransferase involved in LPS biosynthesis
MEVQYYLIHGIDASRKQRVIDMFKRVNIDNNKVKWVLSPNKNEIDDDFIFRFVKSGLSNSNGRDLYAQYELTRGQMSCTFKHFLCLNDIIQNQYKYAVIMEDNNYLADDVPKMVEKYITQLNTLYPDWDILFDNGWHEIPLKYTEQPLKEGQVVYPKSNEIDEICHGGTKLAQFYLLNLNCAKKLHENYLPFNNSPDHWMNDLFRKLNIKSFWAEPSNVLYWKHTSTV